MIINLYNRINNWHIILGFNVMYHNKAFKTPRNSSLVDRLKFDLGELDRELIHIDGKMFKPSQCYRVEFDPVHVLFNTNCPDALKQKIQDILGKHLEQDETGT